MSDTQPNEPTTEHTEEQTTERVASPASEPAPEPAAEPATAPEAAAPKPTAIKPSSIKPSAIKPSSIKPSAIKPSAVKPGAGAPAPAASPAPTPSGEAPLDPAEVTAASEFGRVDADGTVHVRDGESERVVGQYPGVSADEALTLYVRRYLDLRAQVDLFAARLSGLSAQDLDSGLRTLDEALSEPAAVGDLAGLRDRVAELRTEVEARKEVLAAERAAAKEQALAARTSLVEQAEKIAGRDPAKIQWRQEGARLRELLQEWKQAQRSGPRLDRSGEDSLWKRFSTARTTFDRNRRHYFSELDRTHAEAKENKERLIAQAESLSSSTDWGATSAAYRDLMAQWKRSGRASRKEDDALWARFRAAQDVFFEARNAANAAIDAEYEKNLEVKLELLTEAEALLPVQNLERAKSALRDIQERWDEAGKVPRNDLAKIEARMRAVEQAVRGAESAKWTKSDPRVRARAEGAAAQLEAAIESLKADVEEAKASGDAARIDSASEALAARQAWLEQVLQAADDAR